jgi:foldase protein PrsA
MGRIPLIICLAAVAAFTAACGGSSSSSSSASLQSGDVAVVGGTHITKSDLDHQIKLELAAMAVKKQKIPQVGTAGYQSTVVQPVLQYLVTDAQVHNIAKTLSVVVTQKQIQDQVSKAITQFYGGSEAKYKADLQRYKLTDADVAQQFELTLLEQNIEAKLKNQVKVTPKQVQDYYNSHKTQFQTGASTRRVDYVLVPSKAAAENARTQLAAGKSFKAVDHGAIDDSARHEPFVFSQGGGDTNFDRATFTLKTNELSQPVPMAAAYYASQPTLKGKCKPVCYFVIRPAGDVVKGGQQKSFAAVKAQIQSTLLSQQQTAHLQQIVTNLEKQQKKVTKYAPGFAPPKVSTPSTAPTS